CIVLCHFTHRLCTFLTTIFANPFHFRRVSEQQSIVVNLTFVATCIHSYPSLVTGISPHSLPFMILPMTECDTPYFFARARCESPPLLLSPRLHVLRISSTISFVNFALGFRSPLIIDSGFTFAPCRSPFACLFLFIISFMLSL